MGAARRGTRRRLRLNSAYLFVFPSLLLITVFIAAPIIQSGWMSLHDWMIGADEQEFVGLGNYREAFADERFRNAMQVTLTYTFFVAVGQVLLGLLVASRLRQTTWYSALLRSAYFFPFIGSLAVVGLVWKFLLDPSVGLVAGWFQRFGLTPIEWLQSTQLALPTLIVVGIWKNLGFTMIVLLAGMQGVDRSLYEAARLDGASAYQQFRHVTLPGLRPALLFTTILATVNGLQLFDLNFSMTGGAPLFRTESLVMYVYQRGFVDFRMGYASAIAWVLFVIIMIISLVQLRVMRYDDVD